MHRVGYWHTGCNVIFLLKQHRYGNFPPNHFMMATSAAGSIADRGCFAVHRVSAYASSRLFYCAGSARKLVFVSDWGIELIPLVDQPAPLNPPS